MKPVGDPKNYQLIFLLCVPYKILEKLIYTHVEPLIDPLLPKEQAGFQQVMSTVNQVVLLTQNIEDSFEAKRKAGVVFVNLMAAYDIVWHRSLTCKLLRLLLDKHTVKMIMELVRNQSFTLTTGDSKQSRICCVKNGVPQGYGFAPLLFNIYTYDVPFIISRKFAYGDDLALLHSSGKWKDLEETLSQDMSTLSAYIQTWRLKLNILSLVYSTAEYCAPVWCHSAHTSLKDSVLNHALRIFTGCLLPTPTDHLLILSGIQPAELYRMGATLSLAHCEYVTLIILCMVF